MILPILIEPNKILRQKAAPLSEEKIKTKAFQRLAADMSETMRAKDGVGLAAPQVGESSRLCVIAKEYAGQKDDLVLINPEWKKLSLLRVLAEEGCLSVPNMAGKVRRYKKIKVRTLDKNGQPINFIAEDMFARIIQHEIDHLDGILFIDKAKDLRQTDKKVHPVK